MPAGWQGFDDWLLPLGAAMIALGATAIGVAAWLGVVPRVRAMREGHSEGSAESMPMSPESAGNGSQTPPQVADYRSLDAEISRLEATVAELRARMSTDRKNSAGRVEAGVRAASGFARVSPEVDALRARAAEGR